MPLLMLFLVLLAGATGWRWQAWSRTINLMLPADSRPARMTFPAEELDRDAFELVARSLSLEYRRNFDHVDRFREAGIRSYRGPETCLVCHREIEFENTYGLPRSEDLMRNLTGSVHYRFFSTDHKNVRGFNDPLGRRPADGHDRPPLPQARLLRHDRLGRVGGQHARRHAQRGLRPVPHRRPGAGPSARSCPTTRRCPRARRHRHLICAPRPTT
ncbi:MAG: hypothetical protein IPI34_15040 [bacterium]|nr:hypothetical protein [bacterium]